MRPDGSIVIDDTETKSHWGTPPKKKASLHLQKITDDEEADAIAMFTSLFGHPPSAADMAEARRLNAKKEPKE